MNALVASALAVALLVWAVFDAPESTMRARLSVAGTEGRRSVRSLSRSRGPAATAAAVLMIGLVAGPGGVALGLVIGAVSATGFTLLSRARRRRTAHRDAAEIARAAEELSGLLRVGSAPSVALARVAEDCPALADAAALSAIGGDPAVSLHAGAAVPGRQGLADLAAAWRVASRTGAAMGTTLAAIADELARREELRAVVAVELAATRSAGLLLGALPFVGLALGTLLQADPVGFLLHDLPGQVCLVVATGLVCAGLLWTDALTERAAR